MRFAKKSLALIAMLAVLPAFGTWERFFAPSPVLWPRWQAHDATSTAVIDHRVWDRWLATYVVPDSAGVNRVAYSDVTVEDRIALDGYLQAMMAVEISGHNRAQQMAYWINLYNALTVRLILDNYPVDSIRAISSPGIFSIGPWDTTLASVEGQDLTLNDIEHRILRPIWQDPRVHYAVNCASVGCPNLHVAAYQGAGMDARLDAAARAYINSPRAVSLRNGLIEISSIYDWFVEDFGGTEAAVIAHMKSYAEPATIEMLEKGERISGTQYDWALNSSR